MLSLAHELNSLDFERVLESGYHTRALRTNSEAVRQEKTTQEKPWFGMHAYFRFVDSPNVRLVWRVPPVDDRQYIDCFPYIDNSGRFRLWDVAQASDLPHYINLFSKRLASISPILPKRGRSIVTALEPERVYLKAPALFKAARRMGYWKDVDVSKGAVQEVCPGVDLRRCSTTRPSFSFCVGCRYRRRCR